MESYTKLRDDQWLALEPLLIGKRGDPGAAGRDNRLFIDALLWHVSHRRPWHSLPARFGKPGTVYMRFRRWNECGQWQQLVLDLRGVPELQGVMIKVTVFADQEILRIRQIAARKHRREAYAAAIRHARDGSLQATPESDSDFHWAGLVDEMPSDKGALDRFSFSIDQ
ncbi:MAG: transposase [Collimonas sp.]|uniref:transposase n=1 Tax=Collimonas sp. TaxID=1963772 RepID=UPI0032664060